MESKLLESPQIRIRAGTCDDAEALADLAARTFFDTFAADNPAQDMADHLAMSYTTEIQHAELQDPRMHTLIVEEWGKMIAYCQLHDGPPPACVAGPQPHEIHRFYVDRPWIGRGVASPLMHRALDHARSLGKRTVWLGVWERNPRAIAFYTKCGFVHVGEHEFLFARQVQTDLVMARPL